MSNESNNNQLSNHSIEKKYSNFSNNLDIIPDTDESVEQTPELNNKNSNYNKNTSKINHSNEK